MKFAHIADCHLGCWRQPEMQQLNLEAFEKVIDKCIAEKVDFVLITGDLFDVAIPPVDVLKTVVSKLREMKENNIACYIVHGSHDYSVSGKSMLMVFEKAGLCVDVAGKSVELKCRGKRIFISGLAGKKGGLEQQELAQFKKPDEHADFDFSILMLHTTVSELANLPNIPNIPSVSIKDFPEGFNYYALGHIHQQAIHENDNKIVAYPGALFPTNFSELEAQHSSNFFIVETDNKDITRQNIRQITESIKPVVNLTIDANNESPLSLKEKILKKLEEVKSRIKNAIITLRIVGKLKNGKPSELDFGAIEAEIKKFGAYYLLRNVSKLESSEFELKIEEKEKCGLNITELEELVVNIALKENLILQEKKRLVETLLKSLDLEKAEDETSAAFSDRLTKELVKTLDLSL